MDRCLLGFGVVLCVVAGVPVSAGLGDVPLYSDANYNEGILDSVDIAFADVNGDGVPDMVTCDSELGAGVRFGAGDGTFGARTDYGMSPGTPDVAFIAEAIEVGDLNGDGHADIAVAGFGIIEKYCDPYYDPDCYYYGPVPDFADSGVHFRLNNGDGTFGALTSLAGLLDTIDLVLADLDGDGDLDVAAVEVTNALGLYYWLNDGSASFGARQQIPIGLFSNRVRAADFDGNGVADLCVVRAGSDSFDVALSSGEGTFASPVSYAVPSGNNPGGLDLGDVDGDGDVDAAVTVGIGDRLAVFYNDGLGGFDATQDMVTGDSPNGVRFADVDDDGDLDALVASSEDREINCHVNDGAGVFGAREPFQTGGPGRIAVADLNDDGLVDLGMSNVRFGSGYTVRLNGAGGLDGSRVDHLPVLSPRSFAMLDFDNDGDVDIAAGGQSAFVSVMINAGDGSFPTQVDVTAGNVPRLVAGDVNGDTFADVVVANFGTDDMTVLLNDTAGGFAAPVSYPVGDGPQVPVLGDFDDDGDLDFAANTATSANGFVSVLFNDGAGVFGAPTSYAMGDFPFRLASGDLTGDGVPDLIVPRLNGAVVSVLVNDGVGVFATPVDYATGVRPSAVELGDVDGDGDLDVLTGNDFTSSQTVTVLFNDGSGVLGGRVDLPVGFGPESLDLADLDGDGDQDLVVVDAEVSGYSVYLNDGTGAFTLERGYLVGRLPQQLEAADVDDDGVMDIAAAQVAGFVSVHFGSGADAPCPADLAAPFGALNFFDVAAYIALYNAGDPAADFAAPMGALNFFDVAAFIAAYNAGCP